MVVFNAAHAPEVQAQIASLIQQMNLEEKVGQMTLIDKRDISPEEVRDHSIGAVLSGAGANPDANTPQSWHAMVDLYLRAALESRLGIPLLYGVDAVHGHGNVRGAVIFPHNVGLGATRSPDLLEWIGRITAKEVLATGVRWDFAPAVCVAHDIRWGRTYESYSEDTALVTELALAYLRGLMNPGLGELTILPSVKHFVGDGGTTWDSRLPTPWMNHVDWQEPTERYRLDQGDTRVDEETLTNLYLTPYIEAIKAGALNIMISHSSWNGLRMHAHHYLLTDVLKTRLGFEGFLVSDWGSINYLDADYYTCVVTAVNAGLDMIMLPKGYQQFMDTLIKAVQNGDVSLERIEDAVSRILRAKIRLGLFENSLMTTTLLESVGCAEHREIAREAVRQSLVLLKNDFLPLDKQTPKIHVAGVAAHDIGLACGGWTIEWQGEAGPVTEGTTLLDGIRALATGEVTYDPAGEFSTRADVGIVVVAEQPYAEGYGDSPTLALADEDRKLIQRMRGQCERLVLILYSGRPLIITDLVETCDAIIAAWLPGSEAGAIAGVLFGDYLFSGKLPFTWPRDVSQLPLFALKASGQTPLWPFGYGLTY